MRVALALLEILVIGFEWALLNEVWSMAEVLKSKPKREED